MGYRWIKSASTKHPVIREVVHRANIYLRDVYGMLQLTKRKSGGEYDFSIVLVLLCVIDGIARDIYPTRVVRNQQKRFRKLICEKMYWGPQTNGWIDKAAAANLLYLEFRNPLVHELGQDRVSKARKQGFDEPVIGKWGPIEMRNRNIDRIDSLNRWSNNWPTIYEVPYGRGTRVKLCNAALYWSVKRMVIDLVSNKASMANAEDCQNTLQT